MDAPAVIPRAVPPRQLAWLRTELADWASDGLISDDQAERIAVRYRPGADHARVSVGRVLLSLGGGFVGIGLIWLVAANLDQLSPVARFVAVAAIWLAFLVGGEVLASRRASAPVVGAARLLAALAIGAVVFQAAQSLQVPAFEPRLVGLWSAAALVHGYATRAYLPFLVGIATGVGWWFSQPLWDEPTGLTVVLLLGAGSVLAASLAVLHDERLASFAWTWRTVAGGMALVAMFVAAIPDIGSDAITWGFWLVLALAVAGLAAVAAAVTRPGRRLLEPAGAIVVLVVATLLSMWQTGTDTTSVDAADWLHAAVSVAAYVVLAVALVALGTLREHPPLTWMAMAGLVVFTTFQSFAVFAPIVTGAWLFVVLGTVFLGTGFLFDRARRGLAQVLDTDTDTEGTVR
ncbi:putative PE-PGRS family protein [metagenome]|uniref:Putative PE-PGRS family protein n=1 Tax=metagenome TaxID=256318 RepID=A0A2P2CGW8_9ZZZZ